MFKYQKKGRTILFVSHDLNAIERFSDRVVLLRKGQIEDQGSASLVITSYKTVAANKCLSI